MRTAPKSFVVMTVDGSAFTMRETSGAFTGTGSLVGEPWQWTSWSSVSQSPNTSITVESHDELTAARMKATKQIKQAGKLIGTTSDDLKAFDCTQWEDARTALATPVIDRAACEPRVPNVRDAQVLATRRSGDRRVAAAGSRRRACCEVRGPRSEARSRRRRLHHHVPCREQRRADGVLGQRDDRRPARCVREVMAALVLRLQATVIMKAQVATAHELIFGADWACFRGDVEGLSDVVGQLAEVVPEQLRRELIAVRTLASRPDGNPFAVWASLRAALLDLLHDDGRIRIRPSSGVRNAACCRRSHEVFVVRRDPDRVPESTSGSFVENLPSLRGDAGDDTRRIAAHQAVVEHGESGEWVHPVPDCIGDAYGGIELSADVAPSAGTETVLASFSQGIVVLAADGHRIASSAGFDCMGSEDDLVAVEIVRMPLEAPVIAIAATEGGRRESTTWLELLAVDRSDHLQQLFAGEIERRDDTGIHTGDVTVIPGGLVYRHPTEGTSMWKYDPAAGRYVVWRSLAEPSLMPYGV